MDLILWGPLIGVGGALVGVLLTNFNQWAVRRQNSALSIESQKADLRTDRREAIYEFIRAVEKARALADRLPKFGPKGDANEVLGELHTVSAEMWARRGFLEVTCRPALVAAATSYAQEVEGFAMMTIAEGLMSEDYDVSQLNLAAVPDAKLVAVRDTERIFFNEARKELYAPKITD